MKQKKKISKVEAVKNDEIYFYTKILYIDGVKTCYRINTSGTIYTMNYKNKGIARPLAVSTGKDGYTYISLQVNSKRRRLRLSRLVAKSFIPIPKKYINQGLSFNDLEVNHIDANIQNNDVSNLEWVTPEDNKKHAHEMNLYAKGDLSRTRKINSEIAHAICKDLVKNEKTIYELMDKYNVSYDIISDLYHQKTWKDISCLYDMSMRTIRGDNISRGEKCNLSKITEEDAINICEMLESGKMIKEISDETGISKRIISKIAGRKSWRHISNNYNFNYEFKKYNRRK